MYSSTVPQTQTASAVSQEFWPFCLARLEQELPPQQFKLWIKPLTVARIEGEDARLVLRAPSRFLLDFVRDRYLRQIRELSEEFHGVALQVEIELQAQSRLASSSPASAVDTSTPGTGAVAGGDATIADATITALPVAVPPAGKSRSGSEITYEKTRLNRDFTFDTLVTGRANDFARAAAMQVVEHLGTASNPLFIYGGVGLGKTHLMHAIGNEVLRANPLAQVRYVHAEDYYTMMVRAIQRNDIDGFRNEYRQLDVLLIDDIQFFNNKVRTQEEFFHAFNALTEAKKQIVITCDTYPKNVPGLEGRLVSRFDWGLTVQIEVPELEMRVAILKKKAEAVRVSLGDNMKAEAVKVSLGDDVAFLIAKRLHSNVRELEGALTKVVAYARFNGHAAISLDLAKEALKDLFEAHNRHLSIEYIQKTVADYYKIKVSDMHAKKRTRAVARPRQVAMWLAKDLTAMSLPAIGEAFGRDHTTVLHACRTVTALRQEDSQLNHDVHVLTQVLRG
ncbi:MAG: chromosomal replication initiator protein DnaA [Azoarcus sp.]|jgi:chromosomal replication initiator protein|nr:chromosomal replication initiator protein DnaA [Azoarcus sp.]